MDELDRSTRILVADSGGLVGSAVVRALRVAGFTDVVGARSAQVDLRDAAAAREFVAGVAPVAVVDAAAGAGSERFLFLGSSCIYPKFAEQPIREDSLLTGPLEATNDAYAIAKIAGIMGVQSYRREFGLP